MDEEEEGGDETTYYIKIILFVITREVHIHQRKVKIPLIIQKIDKVPH